MIQVVAEEKINEYNEQKDNSPQEYESLLIKLEKEVRSHIQTELQMKLFTENLQDNLEELENENIMLRNKLKCNGIKINDDNIGDEQLHNLKDEIEINRKVLKSYELQNLKLSENERKLKSKLLDEQKLNNEMEKKYQQEIDNLKKMVVSYEKKLSIFLEDDYNQRLKNEEMKNKMNIPINLINKNNIVEDNKKISRTHRKNKNDNNNHQNGPALSASSSMEKIERYLMNKFAKTQLQFKSKINIISSASKNNNYKKIPSPYSKSIVDKVVNNEYDSNNNNNNNKLQMNDSALNNIPKKQKKKQNRHKSVENNSKLIRNKNKQDALIKNLLMSNNNNSAFNINTKKNSIKSSKGNNPNYRKVPYTCSLKGKLKNNNNNNNAMNNNINCNGKIINNNINIYAHTLRQDNHNLYIKGNNEKSLHNSLKGSSGNSSARDYYSSRYNNELLNFRKSSLGKKK